MPAQREERLLPRAFDESERQTIRWRLIEAGRREIVRVGLRNLNLDTVVRTGGISKGSFYSFFPSKEAFILEVFAVVEAEARAELEQTLAQPSDDPRALIARFLRFVFDVLDRQPILALLCDPEEAAFLLRSIPPIEWMKRKARDEQYFGELVRRWQKNGVTDAIDADVIAALPRVAMALFQQKEMIGRDHYSAVVDLLVESLADRLTKNVQGRPKRRRTIQKK